MWMWIGKILASEFVKQEVAAVKQEIIQIAVAEAKAYLDKKMSGDQHV